MGRAGVHTSTACHAVTSAHGALASRQHGLENLRVGQAHALARPAVDAGIHIGLNVEKAHAANGLVEPSNRAERAAPHTPRPEEFSNHDGDQGQDAGKRAEEDATVDGGDGREELKDRQGHHRRNHEDGKGQAHLRVARNRALAHRDAELGAHPVDALEEEVDRADPPAKRPPADDGVDHQRGGQTEENAQVKRAGSSKGLEGCKRVDDVDGAELGGTEAAVEKGS